jgi:hypothetical protein
LLDVLEPTQWFWYVVSGILFTRNRVAGAGCQIGFDLIGYPDQPFLGNQPFRV